MVTQDPSTVQMVKQLLIWLLVKFKPDCRLTMGSNWSEVAVSTLLKRPPMISATPISTGRLSQTKVILWHDFTFSSLQAPLLGNHISYTVDVSNVGCHCNSAFYFVQMPGYDAGQVFVIALSS